MTKVDLHALQSATAAAAGPFGAGKAQLEAIAADVAAVVRELTAARRVVEAARSLENAENLRRAMDKACDPEYADLVDALYALDAEVK